MNFASFCFVLLPAGAEWDAALGSNDLDMALLNHYSQQFSEKHGLPQDVRTFPKAVAKIRKQVRRRHCAGGAGCPFNGIHLQCGCKTRKQAPSPMCLAHTVFLC